MIDLTLNSIKIPDISGYTNPYNFGTKITSNIVNKGGLSTREVNNNIISAFGKMRAIAISVDETTSQIEYDAKLYINAESSIQLTLSAATYYGCVVSIINTTNLTHTLSCTYLNVENQYIQPNSTIELIWEGDYWSNISAPTIGEFVVQYPQEKSPTEIYPCTTWQEVNYNGAFFRTYKENVSDEFISNGTLTPQSYKTAVNGLTFSGQEVETEKQSTRPSYSKEISHSHPITMKVDSIRNQTSNDCLFAVGISGSQSTIKANVAYTNTGYLNFSGSTSGKHKHSATPTGTVTSTDTETRPVNYTVKVWERIY